MEPERVTGIGGIFFKARDPEKMAEWYRKHLKLPIQDRHAEFKWRENDSPVGTGRTVWSLFPQDTDYFGAGGSDFMINYRVTNLDRMIEQLRREGVPVEKMENYDYGCFAWITDPEGNRIELWEPASEVTDGSQQ